MAVKEYKMTAVVPDTPAVIDKQQLYVYVPTGSTEIAGLFKVDGKQFKVTDGVLVADMSKLLVLNDPPVEVVEDGGNVGATLEFTEEDSSLQRALKLTLKNIKGPKGDTGATGATGQAALMATAGVISLPSIMIDSTFSWNDFNRTPNVGEQFSLHSFDGDDVYLIGADVVSVADASAICRVFSALKISGEDGIDGVNGVDGKDGADGADGKDGADGQSALWYDGGYVTIVPTVGNTYSLNNFFSRTPVKGEQLFIPIQHSVTGDIYWGYFQISTVLSTGAATALLMNATKVSGDKGDKGDTGAAGATGATGTSIDSVETIAVDGGTKIVISLTDGTSSEFIVPNTVDTTFEIVSKLPTSSISLTTIYLIARTDGDSDNLYDEYMYINNKWERIGSTDVNLDGYATETYVDTVVANSLPVSVVLSNPSTATSGTLTTQQLATLQASEENYLVFANEVYRLMDKQHDSGYLTYGHIGADTAQMQYAKTITITISTRGWVLLKNAVTGLSKSEVQTMLSDYEKVADHNNEITAVTEYIDEQIEEHAAEYKEIINTETDNAIANANAYTDSEITLVKSYVNTQDSTTLESAKSYTDEQVSAAKTALQSEIASGDTSTLSSAKSYSNTNLSTAKSYADSGDATALSSAKSYADTQDSTTLESAKSYTDEQIAAALGSVVSTLNVLDTGDGVGGGGND